MLKSANKVSVIVPVYNTSKYLAECVESILTQTYPNLEILLINDGSTDNSRSICSNFAKIDSRILYIDNTNQGVSKTRNCGIKASSGEYIIFVDSDDVVENNLVEILVNAAEEQSADLVFCGNYNLSTIKKQARHLYAGSRVFEGHNYISNILLPTIGPTKLNFNPTILDKHTPVWARLYRSSIIKDNNIYFIDLNKLPSECLQFNIEYCLHSKKAVYVDKPLYVYRRNTIMSVTKPYRDGLIDKWIWWDGYIHNYMHNLNVDKNIYEAINGRLACSLIPLGGNAIKIENRRKRIDEFKNILNTEYIQKSLSSIHTHKTKFYWKFFFYSAKEKLVYVFIALTWTMRKILSYRKS